ncbi:Plant UBX domain-containing protein 4 [Ranunculus cassubicifolius]
MEVESVDDHKKLVETFCAITSSSPEEALFFLESHNFDLDSAVSTFYENNTIDEDPTDSTQQLDNPHSLLNQSPSPLLSSDPPRSTVSMASRDKKPSTSRAGGIRTLADLNRQSDHHASDSDSDEPQEFYTGGEKSGMLVQGPPKAPPKGNNEIESIFDQARQVGAMDGAAVHNHSSSSSRSFAGTGRLLSGEPATPAASTVEPPQSVIHNIVFWNNGFTVNDGPLRNLFDPENAPFLESIKKSECPQELEPADRRTQIKVNLIRKEENYSEPEKVQVPFQGRGRTLGSTRDSTETPPPSQPAASGQTASPSVTSAPSPSVGLVVDSTLPSTSIQLRLADGTRMVARFNYHHTVGNIRAFIDASRPGSPRTYNLQTVGFPPKQLTDVTQTIEQAGLANSVVIQKL